jgi:hypothetical protein
MRHETKALLQYLGRTFPGFKLERDAADDIVAGGKTVAREHTHGSPSLAVMFTACKEARAERRGTNRPAYHDPFPVLLGSGATPREEATTAQKAWERYMAMNFNATCSDADVAEAHSDWVRLERIATPGIRLPETRPRANRALRA